MLCYKYTISESKINVKRPKIKQTFRPRTKYPYQYPRHPCLNESVFVTVLFFLISVVSFLVLLFFIGILWASIFPFSLIILRSFYIDWLRLAPEGPLLVQTLPLEFVPLDAGLVASAIAALPSFWYQRYCDGSSNDRSDDSNGWLCQLRRELNWELPLESSST